MALASSEVTRNRRAAVYLLTSVVGISVVPLAMVVVGAPDSPLLFGAFLSAGTSVGALAFLLIRYGPQLRDPRIRSLIRANLISRPMFFILLGTFEFTFFAWATQFIDAAVATILWGSWPIIFVFLLQRVFSGGESRPARYRRITPSLVVLMVFSLVGLAFVVLAQASSDAGLDWTSDLSYLGFLLATLSGVLITFNIFSFSWAADLSRKSRRWTVLKESQSMELFFITVVVCLSNAFTAPIKIGFSLAASEAIQLDVVWAGLILGATIRVGASILWRHANLITHALGINALGYAEPLFGVLWLALFWTVEIPRVDFLIIGTCAIISSNLLINSEVDIPSAFKSTILTLWSTGALIYFRQTGWEWEFGRYWSTLAALTVIFALLMAIRINRPPLTFRGKHAQPDRHFITTGHGRGKPLTVRTRFDTMQMITLGAYGSAAVLLSVLVRPVVTDGAAWLVETAAVLFCAAIVGLGYHAAHHPSRLSLIAQPPISESRNQLSAQASVGRGDRRIAVWTFLVITAGALLCYAYLLWDKWLG